MVRELSVMSETVGLAAVVLSIIRVTHTPGATQNAPHMTNAEVIKLASSFSVLTLAKMLVALAPIVRSRTTHLPVPAPKDTLVIPTIRVHLDQSRVLTCVNPIPAVFKLNVPKALIIPAMTDLCAPVQPVTMAIR